MFNNKTRTFLLLTLVFIAIMGVSAASATDVNSNATDSSIADTTTAPEVTQVASASVDNTQSDVIENTQITKNKQTNVKSEGEGTFTEFKELIDNSENNSEIKLDKDYIKGESEPTIDFANGLGKTITIDANGHTLTSTTGMFVFETSSKSNLTLSNVIITGHGKLDKSYITIGPISSLTLNNVTFKDCMTEYSDVELIHTNGNNIKLNFNELHVDGINSNTYGLMLHNNQLTSTTTITNSLFENINSATGTLLLSTGNLSIQNTTFRNCKSLANGGAIYVNQIAIGGNTVIDNCYFENISSKNNGGAIVCTSTTGVTISNSIFKDIACTGDTATAVGAICNYLSNALILENNTIEGTISSISNADIYIRDYLQRANLASKVILNGQNTTVRKGETKVLNYTVTDDNGNSIDFENSALFTVTIGENTYSSGSKNGTISIPFDANLDAGNYPVSISYNSARLTGEVIIPDTSVTVETLSGELTLNDGNWTEYFDEEGNVRSYIEDGSVLKFEGNFNNRNMVIPRSFNLTTADEQAVLNNCTITVKADNVNVTNLEMNSEDYADFEILVDGVSNVNIEENTLTMTNNGESANTRAVELIDSANSVVKGNTVTVTGPEGKISYDGTKQVVTSFYTAAIHAKNTEAIVIDSNTVTSKTNGKTTGSEATIYGIFVEGNYEFDEDYEYDRDESEDVLIAGLNNSQIINNEISVEALDHAYGIEARDLNEALVKNNTVTVTSDYYAAGIEGFRFTYSVMEYNTIKVTAKEQAYGINVLGTLAYMWDMETYDFYMELDMGHMNEIQNNSITLDSRLAWGIELFVSHTSVVLENNITIDADHGVGVGLADSHYGDVSNNNINITATNDGDIASFDTVDASTSGVKLVPGSMATADINAVYENNININAPKGNGIYGVDLETDYNMVFENYIIAPDGKGDDGVYDDGEDNIIQDNLPLSFIVTDTTYSTYFDEDGIIRKDIVPNGSYLIVSGEIFNKNFTFDGVEVTFENDGTAILYNTIISVINDSKVTFDGLVIENENTNITAVVLESEANTFTNSKIIINDVEPVHVIEVSGDNNVIQNIEIDAVMAAGDVDYTNGGMPAATAMYVKSNNNQIENVTINLAQEGIASESKYPTIEGLTIGVTYGASANDNTFKDITIDVKGTSENGYVYGINFDNAVNTEIENVAIKVESPNYADAIQFMTADNTKITGSLEANSDGTAYGIYAGMGDSTKNIDLTGLDMNINGKYATAALFQGTQNVTLSDSTIEVTGESANAITTDKSWTGSIAKDITVNNVKINIETDDETPSLTIKDSDNIAITNNEIKNNKGSRISFTNTTDSEVTENYIVIADVYIADYGVTKDEDSAVTIKNNKPESPIIKDLEEKLNDTETRLNETEQKLNETQDQLDDIAAQIAELQKLLEELQKQLDELTAPENTTLTVDDIADTKYNSPVTVTGKLVDSDGNGISDQTITVLVNGVAHEVTTENGVYTYTYNAKRFGINTITVNFDGVEDKYNPSTATTTFNLEKQDTVITIDEIGDIKYKEDVTITGTFTDANGNALVNSQVVLTINSNKTTVKTDSEGVFTYTTKAMTIGENTITVSYGGNAKYIGTSTDATFNVVARETVITIDPIESVSYRDEVKITGKFTDENGIAIVNTNLVVTINGVKYETKTNNKGIFELTLEASTIGENQVTVSYKGNSRYAATSAESTFNVTKKDTIVSIDSIVTENGVVTISGKFTDIDGVALIRSNVVLYAPFGHKTVKTDDTGAYTVTGQSVDGKFQFHMEYGGNANYNAYSSTPLTITVDES